MQVDALQLLQPGAGRQARPKRLAVLLRGLPGSGKSHVARLLREREVAAGGEAPRILSLDDYFMTVSCWLYCCPYCLYCTVQLPVLPTLHRAAASPACTAVLPCSDPPPPPPPHPTPTPTPQPPLAKGGRAAMCCMRADH